MIFHCPLFTILLQSVTILGATYYNILFVSAAASMIYERCKNHTIEIKNKFNEFMNVIDVNDNKFEAFNKIVQSDKYQKSNIIDLEVSALCLHQMLEYKKK